MSNNQVLTQDELDEIMAESIVEDLSVQDNSSDESKSSHIAHPEILPDRDSAILKLNIYE